MFLVCRSGPSRFLLRNVIGPNRRGGRFPDDPQYGRSCSPAKSPLATPAGAPSGRFVPGRGKMAATGRSVGAAKVVLVVGGRRREGEHARALARAGRACASSEAVRGRGPGEAAASLASTPDGLPRRARATSMKGRSSLGGGGRTVAGRRGSVPELHHPARPDDAIVECAARPRSCGADGLFPRSTRAVDGPASRERHRGSATSWRGRRFEVGSRWGKRAHRAGKAS